MYILYTYSYIYVHIMAQHNVICYDMTWRAMVDAGTTARGWPLRGAQPWGSGPSGARLNSSFWSSKL